MSIITCLIAQPKFMDALRSVIDLSFGIGISPPVEHGNGGGSRLLPKSNTETLRLVGIKQIVYMVSTSSVLSIGASGAQTCFVS